ncbi:MAG: L,D-transpeptidase family protein [Candidatus Humimicrobiaceae bacterium]
MNKFKKIIDIIIIGIAIVVVIVLGDKIIKIGDDVQDGKYPGYEQEDTTEIIGDEKMIPDSNNTVVALSLNMEKDQSLFQEREDIPAAVPKEENKKITDATAEIDDKPQESPAEVLKSEEADNEPEDTDVSGKDDSLREVSEESSTRQEEDISIIENIDYSNSEDFRIEVDLPRQRLIVFYSDEVLKEFVCSGGTPGDDTPLGEFTTIEKIEYSWIDRYNVGAYYWVRFFGNYLIHSVPFDENGEMIIEEFEKLGQPASHGCIRLRLDEAKWLYETLPLGVKVLIY